MMERWHNSNGVNDDDEDNESVASRDFSDDFSCQISNPDLRLKFKKRSVNHTCS